MSDEIVKLLGTILEGEHHRDAIHIAVAPVIANEKLFPGQDIGLLPGTTNRVSAKVRRDDTHGIVDPFLAGPVMPEQQFFMFLYPGTITSLRHEWTHPAFKEEKVEQRTAISSELRAKSVEWLTDYASDFEMTYDDLIRAGKAWVERGIRCHLHFDTPDNAYSSRKEFWRHFEIVTGMIVEDHDSQMFTCSC